MATSLNEILGEAQTLAWQVTREIPRDDVERQAAASQRAGEFRRGVRMVGAAAADALDAVTRGQFPDRTTPLGSQVRAVAAAHPKNLLRMTVGELDADPKLERIAVLLGSVSQVEEFPNYALMDRGDQDAIRAQVAAVAATVMRGAAVWAQVDHGLTPQDRRARSADMSELAGRLEGFVLGRDDVSVTVHETAPIGPSSERSRPMLAQAWAENVAPVLRLGDAVVSPRAMAQVATDMALLHRSAYQLVDAAQHGGYLPVAEARPVLDALRQATVDAVDAARGWAPFTDDGARAPWQYESASTRLHDFVDAEYRRDGRWVPAAELSTRPQLLEELRYLRHEVRSVAPLAERYGQVAQAAVAHRRLAVPLPQAQYYVPPHLRRPGTERYTVLKPTADVARELTVPSSKVPDSARRVTAAVESSPSLTSSGPHRSVLADRRAEITTPTRSVTIDAEASDAARIARMGRPTSPISRGPAPGAATPGRTAGGADRAAGRPLDRGDDSAPHRGVRRT